ncbi:MAG: DNA topoisomerase IB, partial [Lysobacter sp.]|nr:DNA topoisomerase IB [Lysobacter sp.]
MGASPELAVTAVQHQSNDALQAAAEAGLRYVSDVEPGIRRVGSAADFEYRDPDGTPVTDLPTLERIRSLAIPPAYHDVWICLRRNGHLQATGRDARGRKQYRYHPRWQEVRGVGKFDRVIAFGEALPRLRRRLTRDLKLPGFPQGKVQAIVVALLAATLVRIGNDEYARSNKSFGLTTLRNRHVA